MKSAPNPMAGVEAAQAYLDQNRESLRGKMQGVKTVRGFQLSAEAKKTLETSMLNGASAVAGLQMDYVTQMAMNDAFRSKLEKLVTDYRNLVSE